MAQTKADLAKSTSTNVELKQLLTQIWAKYTSAANPIHERKEIVPLAEIKQELVQLMRTKLDANRLNTVENTKEKNRLLSEKESLLKTGVYSISDPVIRQINKKIEELA